MSDRIVMLIIMRIKYRFLNYSLAPNASRAQYVATNKENDMNNKLIQELLDDKETRDALWAALMEADDTGINIHDLMLAALNKLNDTLVKGDMITIEVSDYMWVRGEYFRTTPSGGVVVELPANRSEIIGAHAKYYQGKRVDLVIKGEEGEADV